MRVSAAVALLWGKGLALSERVTADRAVFVMQLYLDSLVSRL